MANLLMIEKEVWDELLKKVDSILLYIQEQQQQKETLHFDAFWLNNQEVCEYLHISKRTLFRMRKDNEITYSKIHGQYFYRLGSIRKMIELNAIKSTEDYMNELTQKAQNYVEKGRRIR